MNTVANCADQASTDSHRFVRFQTESRHKTWHTRTRILTAQFGLPSLKGRILSVSAGRMDRLADGTTMPCPNKGSEGSAVSGTYMLVEGADVAFVDDETNRGAINPSTRKDAWHCNRCGYYFLPK